MKQSLEPFEQNEKAGTELMGERGVGHAKDITDERHIRLSFSHVFNIQLKILLSLHVAEQRKR